MRGFRGSGTARSRQSILANRRLLVISQTPPPVHGSTIMTALLTKILASESWEVQLVDRRFSRTLDEVGKAGFRKGVAALSLLARLVMALRTRPRVVIFFTTNRPGSLLVDSMIRVVLDLGRVKTINYIHTNGYSRLARRGRGWELLIRRLIGGAELNVVLGSSLSDDIQKWARPGSIQTIANAVEEDEGDSSFLDGAKPLVLFYSNLLPEKGALDFVTMASEITRAGVVADFVIAGPAPDLEYRNEIVAAIAGAGLSDRVQLIGAINASARGPLLASAALLVFPSVYPFEAQPLSIIEAFAAATPVVAYDVGGIRDLVPSSSGLLVPAGDVGALSRTVADLLGDPAEIRRRSDEAHARFRSNHALTAFSSAWMRILDSYTK